MEAPQHDTEGAMEAATETATETGHSEADLGGSLLTVGMTFSDEDPDETPDDTDGDEAEPEGREPEPFTEEDFTIPPGQQVDQELMQEFLEQAGAMRMSKKDAQKLLDMHARVNAKSVTQWTQTKSGWEREIRADKVYGGENYNRTVAMAQRALNLYDDKKHSLARELHNTGMGSNPRLIRFLANVAKAANEDGVITGKGSVPIDTRPLEQRLWPDD